MKTKGISWEKVEMYSRNAVLKQVTFRVKYSKSHEFSNLFDNAAKFLKKEHPYILHGCQFSADEGGHVLELVIEPLGKRSSIKLHRETAKESRDLLRRLERKG